ncbi:MAG: hypothetical protein HY369_00725 [Candidatus Aenigmarchaeota archaeon]|nr:hypothetical protein [Candidatus Aenigmarchaeota archaeon]
MGLLDRYAWRRINRAVREAGSRYDTMRDHIEREYVDLFMANTAAPPEERASFLETCRANMADTRTRLMRRALYTSTDVVSAAALADGLRRALEEVESWTPAYRDEIRERRLKEANALPAALVA